MASSARSGKTRALAIFAASSLLLAFPALIFAQSAEALPGGDEPKNYRIRETEDGREEIVQTLGWEGSDAALFYEVQIERREEDGGFAEFLRETTEEDSIEVSLAAGSWRMRVIAYNLLGKADSESEWHYFDILKAQRPSVSLVSPAYIYLDESDGVLTIFGERLQADSAYSLVETEGGGSSRVELLTLDGSGSRASVRFDLRSVREGTYALVVTNPGGFEARSGNIAARFQKRADFTVSAGYQAPAVIFGDTFKSYFKNTFYPLGFGMRATFFPLKRDFGYFGLGLLGSYTRMTMDAGAYSISGNLMAAHLNFAYQFPIVRNRFLLETHGGAGLSFFNNLVFNFEGEHSSDAMNSAGFSVDAGLAFLVYFTRSWYLDVSADIVTAFMRGMPFGFVAPQVSTGWRF